MRHFHNVTATESYMGKLRRRAVRAEDCNGVVALAYDFADQALDLTFPYLCEGEAGS
jgi:hypothetical protein